MKTVNLELSKELKEAGYPQKGSSLYRWMHTSDEIAEWRLTTASNPEWIEVENFAAPTADEMLDQLPWQVKDGMDRGRLVVEKSFFDKKWKVTYVDYGSGGRFAQSNQDENIANSAAKMWLYLKKEDLL